MPDWLDVLLFAAFAALGWTFQVYVLRPRRRRAAAGAHASGAPHKPRAAGRRPLAQSLLDTSSSEEHLEQGAAPDSKGGRGSSWIQP